LINIFLIISMMEYQVEKVFKNDNMIPKIIHYCWLSDDPVPEKLQNFMKSWKKYLPDYEFMKWDFKRFPKDKCAWVSEAFDNKKYAFAADYIRIYALYNYGGIYLDMDVEVLKSFDDLLSLPYFLCYEEDGQGPEVAAFGAGGGRNGCSTGSIITKTGTLPTNRVLLSQAA